MPATKKDWTELAVYLLIFSIPFQSFNIKLPFITLSPANIIMISLSPFYILRLLRNQYYSKLISEKKIRWLLTMLICLIVATILSALNAKYPVRTLRLIITVIGNFLLLIIVLISVENLRIFYNCIKVIFFSVILLSISTILIGLGILPNYFEDQGLVLRSRFTRTLLGVNIPFIRNTGFIMTQGTWSVWSIPVIAFSFIGSVDEKIRTKIFKNRLMLLSSQIILFNAIIATQSRTIWFGAFAVVSITSYLIYFKTLNHNLRIALFCLSSILAILFWGRIEQVVIDIADEGLNNIYDRLYGIEHALSLISSSPLLGVGRDVFAENFRTIANSAYVHNSFLQFFLYLGLLGFVPFCLIIFLCLSCLFYLYSQENSQEIRYIVCAMISSIISIITVSNFYPGFSDKGLWCCLALSFSLWKIRIAHQ